VPVPLSILGETLGHDERWRGSFSMAEAPSQRVDFVNVIVDAVEVNWESLSRIMRSAQQ
jgi:hypothetical protein